MKRVGLALLLVACGGGPGTPSAGGGGVGGSSLLTGGTASGGAAASPSDDPEPELDVLTWERLRALAPASLPSPGADASNRWADDPAAGRLGQQFFFDARFSGALLDGDNDGSVNALGRKGDVGKVSCAGCHVPTSGFSDSRTLHRQISLAAGWGLRRAPSLLDVGQSPLLMWDGRRDSLFSQPFGVLESEVEMNSSRLYAAQRVFEHYRDSYEKVFGPLPPLDDADRFPVLSAEQTGCRLLGRGSKCVGAMRGAPGDGAEFDRMSLADQDAVTRVWVNVGKALGAYQRSLSCGPSRFDDWVHGDESALTRAEQRGAVLFIGKAGCVSCHNGPFLSDERFHNVGLQPQLVATVFIDADDPGASVGLAQAKADPLNTKGSYSDGDDGRLPEQVNDDLLGAFRTPRLRCVASRPAFMHTGQFRQLSEVVDFFARGGDSFGFLGESELRPLDLSARERADLTAFLGALTGPGPDAKLLEPPP